MSLINSVIEWILGIFDSILPSLNLSSEFLMALDGAITFLISLLEKANYFIPLDTFVICLTTMLIADNFTLLIRLGQWVIKTIRG